MSVSPVSMLLQFEAANFRSFRDHFELDLLATRMAHRDVVRQVRWRDGDRWIGVLPGAGIFGGNASGKTNVLRAMSDMRSLVLHSFRSGTTESGFPRRPFRLDQQAAGAPSEFKISLVLDNVRFDYGFVIDDERVHREWCYRFPKGRAALVFEREGDQVEHSSHLRSRGRRVAEILRPNSLFISAAATANYEPLLPLYAWFSRNLVVAESHNRPLRIARTAELLGDESRRSQVRELLQAADLGITSIERHPVPPELLARLQKAVLILSGREGEPDGSEVDSIEIPDFDFRLVHEHDGHEVAFDLAEESLGTIVWVGLLGPVLDALESGSVLLADELDASLHPVLVHQLVSLFQSPTTNPRGAQLIFNAHETTLLGNAVEERAIGRDQVWFTEKLRDGSTRLYPLADFNPRLEESVSRRYLRGLYGGIPLVADEDFEAALTDRDPQLTH